MPRSGIARLYYLTFCGTAKLLSTAAAPLNIPTSNVQEFQYRHILLIFSLCVSVCVLRRHPIGH